MSVEIVRNYLKQFGAEDRIQEFDVSSATVALAAQALHCEPGRIAKTLSFMAGAQPILIVTAGDCRIDNHKYKQQFGVKAKMMTAEEIDRFTGLRFGGVCPFGIPEDVDIYLDESLRQYDIVYPAAGSDNSAVRVTPEELARFSRAKGWISVGKDAPVPKAGQGARSIQAMSADYKAAALDLVETVFAEHDGAEEGRLVRALVEEIRRKRFYVPELELLCVEDGEAVGYAMFSRFHLEGRYEDELLLLSPVAVKTALQRQHISKAILEHGFDLARSMGFNAVIVEGNPQNYRARGFVTAAEHGILPGKTLHLPHIDCLMVKELIPGALEHIHGIVEYSDYEALH